MPALMTPCNGSGVPDFEALVAKGKELIQAGMSAVIYCGSMGDWPLLTDAQRQEGVQKLVAAGVPVIVGTGAQNPRIAAAHAAHARRVGAAGLMVIPRVLSRGSSVLLSCTTLPVFCVPQMACQPLSIIVRITVSKRKQNCSSRCEPALAIWLGLRNLAVPIR